MNPEREIEIREYVDHAFNRSATRRALTDLLQEIDRLRAELSNKREKEIPIWEPCPHGVKHFTYCKECAKVHCRHWNKIGECHLC